jgi:hypothetical protein
MCKIIRSRRFTDTLGDSQSVVIDLDANLVVVKQGVVEVSEEVSLRWRKRPIAQPDEARYAARTTQVFKFLPCCILSSAVPPPSSLPIFHAASMVFTD